MVSSSPRRSAEQQRCQGDGIASHEGLLTWSGGPWWLCLEAVAGAAPPLDPPTDDVAGEKHFADADFSLTQWIALRLLQDRSVTTASELARELQMTSGAVTRLIDTFEARRYVQRDRSIRDGRVVHLAITPAGSSKIVEMAPALAAAFNTGFDGFDEPEFAGLVTWLAKLLAALEGQSVRPPDSVRSDPPASATT